MDIYELHSQFCKLLMKNDDIKIICHDFNYLKTNCARVEFAKALLEKNNFFVENEQNASTKNNQRAICFKEKGNELFKHKKDNEALEMYTKSIAHSEINSDMLGISYANRSAVLFQKTLYKECLNDINNALNCNFPKSILQKLLVRKEKCEKHLNENKYTNLNFQVPEIKDKNESIDCASKNISINSSNEFGRFVVAENDIKPGEILALEKPYAKILLNEFYYTHCHNCTEKNFNLIPCINCCLALFCSNSCRENAWEIYHKYECPILHILNYLQLNKLTLVALRISIMARNEFDSIEKYKCKEKCSYKSACYEQVHNLIANTDKRSTNDLFERSVIAAIIYNLVEKNTSFFHDCIQKKVAETFQELLLLHIQTAPSNFHEISELRVKNENSETVEVGCGVYPFLSLLNHSCSPNVTRICYGSEIVLRALEPIAKGEQLFDNYGYHHCLMPKEERQKKTFETILL